MKQISILLLLGVALSFCNLTTKTKKVGTPADDNITPEHAQLTVAQTAALTGGQSVNWGQQGISWSVPPRWTKISDEPNNYIWHSAGDSDAAILDGTVSAGMAENFPIQASL